MSQFIATPITIEDNPDTVDRTQLLHHELSIAVTDQWFYLRDGATYGPISRQQLGQLVASGKIGEENLVWQEGLQDWRPAATQGFVVHSVTPPPPPIAPPPPPGLPPAPAGSVKPPRVSIPLSRESSVTPRISTYTPALRRQPVTTPGRTLLLVFSGLLVVVLAGAAGWMAHALSARSQKLQATAAKSPAQRREPAVRQPSDSTRRAGATDTSDSRNPDLEMITDDNDRTRDIDASSVTPKPKADTLPEARPPRAATAKDSASDSSTSPRVAHPATPPIASVASAQPPQPKPAQDSTKLANDPPQTPEPKILFQELDIERTPKFFVLGAVMAQDLRYQILSELTVGEWSDRGTRVIEQVIKDTKLVRSDDTSRASFTESLGALRGWQFTFRVSRRGDVTEWKAGPKDGRKAVAVEPKGGKGFLVTSVMDTDGWKEMSAFSFFVPPEQTSGNGTWTRPMTHDYGPLGSWYGETRFQKAGVQSGVLRVNFVHHLRYSPPGKDAGALPFSVKSATFQPESAGGTIHYDTQTRRVQAVQERFLVKGELQTELLGEASAVEMEETQVISLRLFEQNPWIQSQTSPNKK